MKNANVAKIANANAYMRKKTMNSIMGKDTNQPSVACLFAGMGGFADGFLKAGFKVLWANELDKHAASSFEANYPGVRMIPKDIRVLSVYQDNLAPVDVLTAGFPCQTFSISGEQKGFQDDRGRLFFEIIRLIEEFGEKKPKILMLENVPNLIGGGDGTWFEQIMREIQQAGYWFDNTSYQILNTCEITEIPQNRERLFMVGVSTSHYKYNGYEFPEKNGKPLNLRRFINRSRKPDADNYLRPDNKYYKKIHHCVENGNDKSIFQLRRYEVREKEQICPTLTANMGGGGHNVPFISDRWGIRRLLVDECAKLQGFDGYQFPEDVPNGERYKQIGNAVSAPVAEKLALSCKSLLAKL